MRNKEQLLRCFWYADWKPQQQNTFTSTHISEDHNLIPMFERISEDLNQRYGWKLSVTTEFIPGTKRWDFSATTPNVTKYVLVAETS